MKYDFNGDELSVILISLIGRRNNIKGLLDVSGSSDSYRLSYMGELKTVESLLEKFFPGSLSSIERV